MKTILQILLFSSLLLITTQCAMNEIKTNEQLQEEIRQVESDFAKMAAEKGIAEAFYFYADENAVLSRNNALIEGKEAIKEYMYKSDYKGVTLEWKPTEIEVAASADMAYTYGNYTYSKKNEDGTSNTQKGIFHTVWKRQENGDWRYVWD